MTLEIERLWATWRRDYVTNVDSGSSGKCTFCDLPTHTDDESLIVSRSTYVYAVLNLFPYSSGHVLVVPYRHVAALDDLTDDEAIDLIKLQRHVVRSLRAVYAPDGLNLGANLGRAAGAGIADHFHTHVLPRWNGDTNFMTVIGGTRVLPESLEQTHERVFAAMTKTG